MSSTYICLQNYQESELQEIKRWRETLDISITFANAKFYAFMCMSAEVALAINKYI